MKHAILLLLFFCGCQGVVHKVGKIGEYEVYSVKLPSAAGPSINVAILQRGSNEPPQVIAVGAGNGMSTVALQAAGLVGAAAALRPDHVSTTSTIDASPLAKPTISPAPVYGPPLPPHMKEGGWGNTK